MFSKLDHSSDLIMFHAPLGRAYAYKVDSSKLAGGIVPSATFAHQLFPGPGTERTQREFHHCRNPTGSARFDHPQDLPFQILRNLRGPQRFDRSHRSTFVPRRACRFGFRIHPIWIRYAPCPRQPMEQRNGRGPTRDNPACSSRTDRTICGQRQNCRPDRIDDPAEPCRNLQPRAVE